MTAGKDILWRLALVGGVLLAFPFLGLPVSASETGREVPLDLSGNTLQFGGFPGQRDKEELLRGICPERGDMDAGLDSEEALSPEMIPMDKEQVLEDLYGLIDTSIYREIPDIDVSAYGLSMDAAAEIVSDVLNGNPTYFFVEGVSVELDPSGETVRSINLVLFRSCSAMICQIGGIYKI